MEFSVVNQTKLVPYQLTHLEQLEAESIFIFRDVAAEFENPVLLYSIGKDSSVLLHLAKKLSIRVKFHFRYCMSTRRGNFEK